MRRLSPLDYAFIRIDSQTSPAHIAGLAILEPLEDFDGDATAFAGDLYQRMARMTQASEPFNLVLQDNPLLGTAHWRKEENVDLDYHLNHIRVPAPGKFDDMMGIVARIHARQLDRTRPMWECYVIEGLEGNRLAVYAKMHHALIDGMTGMKIFESAFQQEPYVSDARALWDPQLQRRKRSGSRPNLVERGGKILRLGRQVAEDLVGQGLQAAGYKEGAASMAFQAPHSLLNANISASRRLIGLSLPMDRMKALGKSVNASLNDVLLMICSAALKSWLTRQKQLPEKPLVAMVPVSVATPESGGNNVSYMMADLATDRKTTAEAIAQLLYSTKVAKEDIANMSKDSARVIAGAVGGSLAVGAAFSNLIELLPPAANVVISNVPGPREPRYFHGARLLQVFPCSLLVDTQALNITALSNGNNLDIGITACRETLPDIMSFEQDMLTAWETLETALSKKSMRNAVLDKVDELSGTRAAVAE